MAYYKKRLLKSSGLWYPVSVTQGNVSHNKLCTRLAEISTVSKSDVNAVLGNLAGVLADYMALGQTVKIDGLGTFYYTAVTKGNGVATEEEVTAKQITGVRVRFIPETTFNSSGNAVRGLVADEIDWNEVDASTTSTTDEEEESE